MSQSFFEKQILNYPYVYPAHHWELDDSGQPTPQVIKTRRRVGFITPIPKLKKRGGKKSQLGTLIAEAKGAQRYGKTADAVEGDQPPRE